MARSPGLLAVTDSWAACGTPGALGERLQSWVHLPACVQGPCAALPLPTELSVMEGGSLGRPLLKDRNRSFHAVGSDRALSCHSALRLRHYRGYLDGRAGGFVLSTSADSFSQGILYFRTTKHGIFKYFWDFFHFLFVNCLSLSLMGRKPLEYSYILYSRYLSFSDSSKAKELVDVLHSSLPAFLLCCWQLLALILPSQEPQLCYPGSSPGLPWLPPPGKRVGVGRL